MMEEKAEERPLVTFALFAYNQEKYIREAIEGAFSQTYEPLEIILSDDCSTDRTFEVMQEMASAYNGPHKVRVRKNEVNLGLAGHINSILAQVEGEFICWAAGDDISLPERTSTLIGPMIDNSDVVGTHSAVQEIDLSGEYGEIRNHNNNVVKLSVESILNTGFGVVSQAHAFRRIVFDTFGPLNEDLSNEGPAMAFRECLLGKVLYIENPTVYYRIGSGVSTYQGGDVIKEKIDEPIKVCKWRLSAYRQMLIDSNNKKIFIDEASIKKIESQVFFYETLLGINTRVAVFRGVVRNLILAPTDTTSLRAAIRVLLPNRVYRLLK